ncbi:hypothetical protein ACLMJK_007618 [Lecanora helva]
MAESQQLTGSTSSLRRSNLVERERTLSGPVAGLEGASDLDSALPTKPGLLDLPPEIRLEIYSHLLTLCCRNGEIKAGCNIRTVRVLSRAGDEEFAPTAIGYLPMTRQDKRRSLWPEILRVCRIIYQEASPVLSYFGENKFNFQIWEQSDGSCYRDPAAFWPSYGVRVEKQWEIPKSTQISHDSVFAAFIAHAGPKAYPKITRLNFEAVSCDFLAKKLPLITELAVRFLPRLRVVEFDVLRKVWFDATHPDGSLVWLPNGRFEPMYEGLADFVERVSWVKEFSYIGTDTFERAHGKLRNRLRSLMELETKVKERAAANKTS